MSLEGVLGWHLLTHDGPPSPPEILDEACWPDWDAYKTRGQVHCFLQ
eukprot:COSAG05_NODE_49_length_24373_cov_16.162561_2_plen_47_part_00